MCWASCSSPGKLQAAKPPILGANKQPETGGESPLVPPTPRRFLTAAAETTILSPHGCQQQATLRFSKSPPLPKTAPPPSMQLLFGLSSCAVCPTKRGEPRIFGRKLISGFETVIRWLGQPLRLRAIHPVQFPGSLLLNLIVSIAVGEPQPPLSSIAMATFTAHSRQAPGSRRTTRGSANLLTSAEAQHQPILCRQGAAASHVADRGKRRTVQNNPTKGKVMNARKMLLAGALVAISLGCLAWRLRNLGRHTRFIRRTHTTRTLR